jgi:hypothetical protein
VMTAFGARGADATASHPPLERGVPDAEFFGRSSSREKCHLARFPPGSGRIASSCCPLHRCTRRCRAFESYQSDSCSRALERERELIGLAKGSMRYSRTRGEPDSFV